MFDNPIIGARVLNGRTRFGPLSKKHCPARVGGLQCAFLLRPGQAYCAAHMLDSNGMPRPTDNSPTPDRMSSYQGTGETTRKEPESVKSADYLARARGETVIYAARVACRCGGVACKHKVKHG